MLHNLSIQITDKIVSLSGAEDNRARVLAYGIEVFLSSAGGIIILIVLSVCLGEPAIWTTFLLGLAPLRMTAGGYHAPTQGKCYGFFATLYVSVMLLSKLAPHGFMYYPWVAAVALALVLLAAPIQTHNKPLPTIKYKRNRKCAIAIAVFDQIAAIVAYQLQVHNRFVQSYYLGIIVAVILMATALIKNGGKEDHST